MSDNLDTYFSLTGETWYYDSGTGLYYSNPNYVGIGYTFSQIEEFEDGVI